MYNWCIKVTYIYLVPGDAHNICGHLVKDSIKVTKIWCSRGSKRIHHSQFSVIDPIQNEYTVLQILALHEFAIPLHLAIFQRYENFVKHES